MREITGGEEMDDLISRQKDTISRQAAIEHLKKRLYETALNNVTEHPYYEEMADNRVSVWLKEVPAAQPEIIRCKDCLMHGSCPFEQGLGLDGYCSQAERRIDEGAKI